MGSPRRAAHAPHLPRTTSSVPESAAQLSARRRLACGAPTSSASRRGNSSIQPARTRSCAARSGARARRSELADDSSVPDSLPTPWRGRRPPARRPELLRPFAATLDRGRTTPDHGWPSSSGARAAPNSRTTPSAQDSTAATRRAVVAPRVRRALRRAASCRSNSSIDSTNTRCDPHRARIVRRRPSRIR